MSRQETVTLTNMVMIEDENRKILVEDKVDPHWKGISFPGGHLLTNESIVHSAIREVKEETGLDIKDLKLVGVNNNVSPNFNRYLVFLFKTKTFSGELKSSEEGKVFWVEKKNLKNYKLTPEFSDLIEIFYNDSINENYAVWDDKGEVKDHLL